MRVLHVGWGFSPWRPGGLIAYAEDLMAAQAAHGHDVDYFLSGRHYPFVSGPRLKQWRRGGVTMHEVVNSPIVAGLEAGTRDPASEISEPRLEAAFRSVLRRVRPDVVHVQELQGLPSSLLDMTVQAGVPTLMTLQDYGPLCTTLRLFDADGRVCLRREVGADCVVRNAAAPTDAGPLVRSTLRYEAERVRRRLRLGPRFDAVRLKALMTGAGGFLDPRARRARPSSERPRPDAALALAYQRRREVNVERLNRVDRLIAQSPRVAEIYRVLGVSGERMRTLPFTLAHIEALRPRALASPPAPLTFATLNGCAAPTKGSEVVLGALRRLRACGLDGRFRLRVLGHVDPAIRAELEAFEGVELGGGYGREQLDGLLDDVDVGLMPSIWEEAFGYTGLELLAKGIPLIANPLGGIVEYAIEGRTAWLNHACSAKGLAARMEQLVREPQLVVEMHRRVLAERPRIVTSMTGHVEAIDEEYGRLAAAQRRSVR